MVRWYGGTAVRQEKHERYLFVIIFFSNFVGENDSSRIGRAHSNYKIVHLEN